MKHVTITIDGPSGSGKSTIAKEIARILGFTFLDTGALYRASAVAVEKAGGDLNSNEECGRIVGRTRFRMSGKRITVDDQDVTELIRTPHFSEASSKVAVHPSVRKALVQIQRSFRKNASLVAEGRDTGSVVFPDADLKFYLDASDAERARRRYRELVEKENDITFEQVLGDITLRDQRDSCREQSPLVVPEHAVVVDTTHMQVADVVKTILAVVKEKLADQ